MLKVGDRVIADRNQLPDLTGHITPFNKERQYGIIKRISKGVNQNTMPLTITVSWFFKHEGTQYDTFFKTCEHFTDHIQIDKNYYRDKRLNTILDD